LHELLLLPGHSAAHGQRDRACGCRWQRRADAGRGATHPPRLL